MNVKRCLLTLFLVILLLHNTALAEDDSMARFCEECGNKLSFFTSGTLCKDCLKAFESEISSTRDVKNEQLELLKKQDKGLLLTFYDRIYNNFESDNELEEKELDTLQKMQNAFNLTNEEIKFDDRVRPYVYVAMIRKGKLPTVTLAIEGSANVVLKKGEIIHHADKAILKEQKTVSLGYSGGSHGVSFRIAKGIRYNIGGHRGHIQRDTRLVETSRGVLIITNQRILLHPFPGYKPASIPLNKILSYQCYNNGLEVYKEGKEKGYFFEVGNPGSVEIFGLCFGHLLGQSVA